MSKRTEQAKALIHYYLTNRQAGHTTAMIEGAKDTGAYVVVDNLSQMRQMQEHGIRKDHIIILHDMWRLVGLEPKPVALDNFFVLSLLEGLLAEIREKTDEINKHKSRERAIKRILECDLGEI